MLTGPTGCGKTRLVEHMGGLLGRPVVTISCHDDLTSSDLVGRFMVTGGDVVWNDGPLTRAVKDGAICYMDEVVEARHDSLAVLHSLTDHRRALYLDRAGEVVKAPGLLHAGLLVQPRLSQLAEGAEAVVPSALRDRGDELPAGGSRGRGAGDRSRHRLVGCQAARELRDEHSQRADDVFHFEPPSTRVLVTAAKLVAAGATELEAAEVCILAPLSNDGAITDGLRELAAASLAAAESSSTTTLEKGSPAMIKRTRKRKRALIILQVVIYGYLLGCSSSSCTCPPPGLVGS